MVSNYLKTALRFLQRNISFTVINIAGLTAGITAFLLIALYLQNELSFDKHLPENAQLYRMVGIQEPPGIDVQHVAITSGGWAPWLNENVPGVAGAFRFMFTSNTLIANDEAYLETTFFSDGKVVNKLGLPVLSGNPDAISLHKPQTAVLSKKAAMRMFGSVDIVGETIRHNDIPYTVLGVFDNDEIQSHIKFHVLLSLITVEADNPWMHWLGNNNVITYIALEPGADTQNITGLINDHYNKESEQQSRDFMKNTFYLQPVEDIYLRSGHIDIHSVSYSGNLSSVYVFILVAILVLVIACINFINLSIAGASRRAREVGMRKVLGANRTKLAMQFMGESMILTFISVCLSLMLLEIFVPEFNILLGSHLQIDFIRNPLFNVGLVVLWLGVGLVSGLYPGWYISKYQPITVLKSGNFSGKPQATWLRKILVVFQFATSAAIILSTIVVTHQVRHMQSKDLGYDPENVLYLSFGESLDYERQSGFRDQLMTLPEVKSIGLASQYNGVAGKQSYIHVADSVRTTLMTRHGYVDPDFFPTMNIEIIKGRNFNHDAATDPYQAALINEATMNALGWEDPIGKRIENTYHEDYDHFVIIGVVRDYNYYSVRRPIAPAIYLYQKDQITTMNIRYTGNNHQEVLSRISNQFKTNFPGLPLRSNFITETLSRQTRSEKYTMRIFGWFSILCLVISCMGLFGLTAFMINQRRKEISIRKVLGSSVTHINLLLMDGFMRMVGFALAAGLTVSYLTMSRWLDNYPYRINIGISHFSVVVVIIAGIAALTILFYSTRAAQKNPVYNLKYE